MTTVAEVCAGRNAGRVDIPIVGDSVTEGYGASQFTTRYISYLNTLIRQAYPTTGHGTAGGLGLVPIVEVTTMTFTVLWSGSAGSITDVGPLRNELELSGSGSYVFTAPTPTTSVKIMWFNLTPGTFSWKVNSGSATNVSSSSGTGVDGVLTASIPMNPGDTLTVARVSGTVYIAGVLHFNQDESTGITFYSDGHFGWSTTDWLNPGSGYDWRPAVANVISGSGAFGIFLGINDSNPADGDETAAQFQSNLGTLITYLRGNAILANLPLLLIVPYEAEQSFVSAWSAYVTAIQNAATTDGHAQVVNLGLTMAPVSTNPGYYYDNYHPNDAGHLLLAQTVNAALAPPPPAYSMRSFP